MALGFSLFRYVRNKQISRLQHHGNIATAGLYPILDESADAAEDIGSIKEPRYDDGERGEENGPHECLDMRLSLTRWNCRHHLGLHDRS